ncbi:MAG: inositol monophosphatase [Thalassobaculaceae bacterium]|nr:inositol monophosphatase [Thalassobaculaceae bacterium]
MTSSSDSSDDPRLATARRVAEAAGRLARRFFEDRDKLLVEAKGPQDLVSAADRDVEALIRREIARDFPEDRVLGEEFGDSGGDAATGWVVDPIDGTQNFLRGIPQFVVSIAYRAEGGTRIGVIHDPNAGESFWATAGGGAFRDGAAIRVSDAARLEEAVIGVGHSPRHAPEAYNQTINALVDAGAQTRNYCCAALQLAYVGDGRLDATWDPYLLDWDVAAGMLIVREAGGDAVPFVPGRRGPQADMLVAGTAGLLAEFRRRTPMLA